MRILIIEDEAELARRVESRLSASGFIVETAHDAESALEIPDPERFAAIVVDLGLPGIGGMDPSARIVWLNGERIDLTQMEYRLLHLFVLRAGHILAQTEILDHLYPMADERDLNTVEVHIGRLRRKVGKDAITTLRGLGYRFER